MQEILLICVFIPASTVRVIGETSYELIPNSMLTGIYQTVTGLAGASMCGHMCLTAFSSDNTFCMSFSYCVSNRTCLLAAGPVFSGEGWGDSDCQVYQIAGMYD